jgi:hypothetical protein
MTDPLIGRNPTNPGAQVPDQSALSPKNTTVSLFHKYDDLNTTNASHHHTIGQGAGQVAPGKHYHNGEDSPALLEGTIFTGVITTYNPTTMKQILAALVKLGAADTTS